jgi:peptidyl-dipeptidase Dcp
MKVSSSILFLGMAIALTNCGDNKESSDPTDNINQETMENPFLTDYATPFEVPPFDKIKNEHYMPAFEKGMEEQKKEIDAIINSNDEPNFENTLLALENSGAILSKVSSVFYNLNSANTSDEIQKLAQELSSIYTAHQDDISLNEELFARIKHVWDHKEELNLNAEQQVLLKKKYESFVRSGANLNNEQKTKLREINTKLSSLSTTFGQNVLAESNSYQLIIENEEDLAGLPNALIETAAETAEEKGQSGKWIFTLDTPSLLPFLQYADNRDLRKEIWTAYKNRGFNDNDHNNEDIIKQIVNLRREKANLLGHENHASFKLVNSMAGSPAEVYELLNKLWTPALEKAKVEAADIQKYITENGQDFELKPYDWRYYTEKIRKERFDLDESEIKPYFSLENVKQGVFKLCDNLYGLQFKVIEDIPVYHEDAMAYEVLEKDGSHVGVLYMDFHPRASKRGGAWMTAYRAQTTANDARKAPVISIVCNFSKPTKTKPSLLTFDEVETFFHEFGHALHGLLSDVTYESLAGTNVYTDFVELPSQVMENWAGEPEFMKTYAFHHETGDVIPDELIKKLENSGTFNQGFATTEYLAASLLDMFYHTMTEEFDGNVQDFEAEKMKEIGLIDEILPRYRSAYFNHVFSGGYSAGYYSYIWSGVLDTDAFEAFKETSLFNQEMAQSFRKNILEKGGTEDPMELYKRFRGRKPDITPLLKKRGLQ